MSYRAIQEECYEANLQLPKFGLVDLTFGNVSVIDRGSGVFGIKPSGVDYTKLNPEDIVLVDLEGRQVSGDYAAIFGHTDSSAIVPDVHENSRRRAHALTQCGLLCPSRKGDPLPRHDACRLLLRRGAGHAADDPRRNPERLRMGNRQCHR